MAFGAVNPVEANSVLGAVLEYGNGITVCQCNNFADYIGIGQCRQEKKKYSQYASSFMQHGFPLAFFI